MAYLDDVNRYGNNLHYRTQSLFVDFKNTDGDKYPPIFTLKEYDIPGYPSLYKLYMEYSSEYEAAVGIIGSWTHWNYLKERSWFKELVDRWEAERETRDKALAKRQLMKAAEEGNVAAQRTLFGTQEAKPKRKTKAQKEQELKAADENKALDEVYNQSPLAH